MQGDAIHPVSEILSPPPPLNQLGNGFLDAQDESEPNRILQAATHPADQPVFQRPKQVELEPRSKIGRLIEIDRAPVGRLEKARAIHRPGKPPSHGAEELRLRQLIRESPADERHEVAA